MIRLKEAHQEADQPLPIAWRPNEGASNTAITRAKRKHRSLGTNDMDLTRISQQTIRGASQSPEAILRLWERFHRNETETRTGKQDPWSEIDAAAEERR